MATKPILNVIGNDPMTGAEITKEPLNQNYTLLSNYTQAVNSEITAHLASTLAHQSQNIRVQSTKPAMSGYSNVLVALEGLQNEIATIIASSGTSDTEVVNARTSTLNGSFSTLKNRLEAHDSSDKPHLIQDTGASKTYRYGFKQDGEHLVFIYEEV